MEREQGGLIHEWLSLVEKQEDLMTIPLSYETRTGHLPMLLRGLIARLKSHLQEFRLRRVVFGMIERNAAQQSAFLQQ